MRHDKPNLPKRLAAKIVAAQNAVTAARRHLHYSAERLARDQYELVEFEHDPVAYAAQHYRGMPVESYPVQEHIRRCRADVAHRTPRQSLHQASLAAAEAALVEVERSVLDELQRMRPDTPGRVAWPDPLPSLEEAQAQWRWDDAKATQELAEQERHEAVLEEADRLLSESAEFHEEVNATIAEAKAALAEANATIAQAEAAIAQAAATRRAREEPGAGGAGREPVAPAPVASAADSASAWKAPRFRDAVTICRALWAAWRR